MPLAIPFHRLPFPHAGLTPLPAQAFGLAPTTLDAGLSSLRGLEQQAMEALTDTADPQLLMAMLRYLKGLDLAASTPLDAANVSAVVYIALRLYDITGQKALIKLAERLCALAPDWAQTFAVFPQTRPVTHVSLLDVDAFARLSGHTMAAGLAMPALQALFHGGEKNQNGFETGFAKLQRYHGAAHGLFNADPYLAGTHPSRTVDGNTVLTLYESTRTALWALGKPLYADLLEHLALNALPAARGAQAANQLVPATQEGLTAPLRDAVWANPDGGLSLLFYRPLACTTRMGSFTVETDYPRSSSIEITITATKEDPWPLDLRIPAWCEGATVKINGGQAKPAEQGTFHRIRRAWKVHNRVELSLPMTVRTLPRHHQAVSFEVGPRAFALPVAEGTAWQFGVQKDTECAFTADTVTVQGARVPDWTAKHSIPTAPPIAPAGEAYGKITLVPYAETTARIATLPVLKGDA